MNKPETALRNNIALEVRIKYGTSLYMKKIHGSPYQEAGIPDLIGCLKGKFIGMEIKQSGCKATPIQEANIRDIRRAGGYAQTITSIKEALEFMEFVASQVIENK
jgi:hypothetical protein